MSSWGRFVAVLCLLVLAATCLAVPAASSETDSSLGERSLEVSSTVSSTQTSVLDDANGTEIRLEFDVEGNARWHISQSFNITTSDQLAAFETLSQEFENGETPQLGLQTFETTVSAVDDRTERPMELSNVQRSSEVDESENRGVVTLSFTWENFGAQDDDRIVIDGSVLRTDAGLWFRGLTHSQQLVIVPPQGYGVDDASVAPQNGRLEWTGPADFDDETLQVTFIGNRGSDNGTDPQISSDQLGFLPFVLAGILLLLAATLVATRREQVAARLETVLGPEADETSPDAESSDEPEPEPSAEPAEPAAETTETDDTDVELLSDEERVERLLENNGGRMKQANIVSETGWSNAKVSQLLSAMDDDGRIDKLRIGRENLISFPDQDIADLEDDE